MKLSKILTYIFACIAIIFEGFFGIISFVSFILQIILLSFGVFLLIWMVRRSRIANWKQAIPQYILTMTATIGFFTAGFLSFIGYQYMVPGVVSDITLSHSGQQIVFIEMSHIASPNFFHTKKDTIKSLSQSGYTILYEGVKPGTPQNQSLFDTTIGFKFTPTLYTTIATLIGLSSQDNHDLFAGISTGSLVSVDLSIDDIMALMGTGSVSVDRGHTGSISDSLPDLESQITSIQEHLTPQERHFIGWVGRGLLSWSLRRSDDIDIVLTTGSQADMFTTIVDRRNDAIITYIRSHPHENIAIVYGALHFNGVYEALQKIDATWQISHIENSEPYQL